MGKRHDQVGTRVDLAPQPFRLGHLAEERERTVLAFTVAFAGDADAVAGEAPQFTEQTDRKLLERRFFARDWNDCYRRHDTASRTSTSMSSSRTAPTRSVTREIPLRAQ